MTNTPPLFKTSYGISRILNFDWLKCTHLFCMTVADFQVFLWVFLIKQLFHSCLLDMR